MCAKKGKKGTAAPKVARDTALGAQVARPTAGNRNPLTAGEPGAPSAADRAAEARRGLDGIIDKALNPDLYAILPNLKDRLKEEGVFTTDLHRRASDVFSSCDSTSGEVEATARWLATQLAKSPSAADGELARANNKVMSAFGKAAAAHSWKRARELGERKQSEVDEANEGLGELWCGHAPMRFAIDGDEAFCEVDAAGLVRRMHTIRQVISFHNAISRLLTISVNEVMDRMMRQADVNKSLRDNLDEQKERAKAASADAAAVARELKTAQSELADERSARERIERQLAELQADIDAAREQAADEARAENARLIDELTAETDRAGRDAESLSKQLDAAHERTDRLERDLEEALKAAPAAEPAAESPATASTVSAPAAALSDMARIPRTCREAAEVAAVAFPNLAITSRALDSADEWDGDVGEVWEILRALSKALEGGMFSGGRDLQGEFKQASGYTLSMREVNQTNANKRLKKLRRINYDGEVYDITPHVKGRARGNDALRVYFSPDVKHGRVVVGRIGSHLETDGTRRKKMGKRGK